MQTYIFKTKRMKPMLKITDMGDRKDFVELDDSETKIIIGGASPTGECKPRGKKIIVDGFIYRCSDSTWYYPDHWEVIGRA